jgi:hypothetical protein
MHEVQSSLDHAVVNLERFEKDPDSGYFWSKRSLYGIVNSNEVIKYEARVRIATSMKECILKRCANVPGVFAEAVDFLNTAEWTYSNFFTTENNEIKHKNIFDNNIKALIDNEMLRQQLENKNVDIGNIISEWISLKNIMKTWKIASSKSFPPLSWAEISINVKPDRFNNLFSLIDFLLCHSLSSADAERGFSAMKNIKTKHRSRIGNKLLTIQLRIKIDGKEIELYDPTEAIENWLLKPSRINKSGIPKGRRPNYMDNKTTVVSVKKPKQIKIFFA